ncbi:hypothetical protein ACFWXO_44675 [Kitasatospora sp. NPDC059088]|uniref:hypothetical protein n=1 Tax=Kitasatospora sp. NPDC059088 TaxID=3346722 RepID=UPI00368E069B
MPGQDPGQHVPVAGLLGGPLGGGEPAVGVALVAPVVLDDRDEASDPGGGAGQVRAGVGGVGSGQDIAQEVEVGAHLREDDTRRAPVVAAPVALERPVEVGEITRVGPRQARVDALPGLRDAGQGNYPCRRGCHTEKLPSLHRRSLFPAAAGRPLSPAPAPGHRDRRCDLLHRPPVPVSQQLVPLRDGQAALGLPALQVLRVEPPAALGLL